MTLEPHSIGTIRLECRAMAGIAAQAWLAEARGHAEQVHEHLRQMLLHGMPCLLDDVLEPFDPPNGSVLRLGRIDVNLGAVRSGHVLEAMAERLPAAMAGAASHAAVGPSATKEGDGPAPFERRRLHIDNAGLVLLTPFLRPAMRDAGLLRDETEFTDNLARLRGMLLLQRMAGQDDTAGNGLIDDALALNKELCGWPDSLKDDDPPFSAPVPGELEGRFNMVVEQVLASLLQHWQAAAPMSPDALQRDFLRRPGVLEMRPGPYLKLYVGREPQDVLLNTLPWVISIIQTPWMLHPMQVVWND